MYFDINQRSVYSIEPQMTHLMKVKPDPNDPAPDLTMQVARSLARQEHPRKRWQDYGLEDQSRYMNIAAYTILNIVRWTREHGYGR